MPEKNFVDSTLVIRKLIRPLAVLLVGSLSSCNATLEKSLESIHRIHLEPSQAPDGSRALWEKSLPGIATDLSVARDSGDILISLNPDPEGFKRLARPTTQFYSPSGDLRWQFHPQSRVRGQAVRADGGMALVSAYNEKVTALDRNGKVLWQVRSLCTPHFLPDGKRALCYFDDDNRPRVAFDILSLTDGSVLYSHAIDREVLQLSLSPDGSGLAYALTGGSVRALDADFHTLWTREIEGEVLDLAVAMEPAVVWVLEGARMGTRPRPQRLMAFSREGTLLARTTVPWHASALRAHSGNQAFVYGNSPQGQVIGGFELEGGQTGGSIRALFRGSETKFADFSSPLRTGPRRIFFGMENVGHEILATDSAGRVRWATELRPEDAGFQMEFASLSPHDLRLVLATDSGWLRAFGLSLAE